MFRFALGFAGIAVLFLLVQVLFDHLEKRHPK
jgi:hypothetical protein